MSCFFGLWKSNRIAGRAVHLLLQLVVYRHSHCNALQINKACVGQKVLINESKTGLRRYLVLSMR